jgi:haloacetate dehalogenase
VPNGDIGREHCCVLIGCSFAGGTLVGMKTERIEGADGVVLNVAVEGSGPAIVLLHGFPQTHLMWRHVAPRLAEDHTVICPDLRGYGESDKPAGVNAYAKREMARDVLAVSERLGFSNFALVGHDRGALVAFRAALDHPRNVTHLASLDVLPTLDMWEVMHGVSAKVGFHLYLMAQPPGRGTRSGPSSSRPRTAPRTPRCWVI